ncbi:DUF4180 domain-containing protein [Pelagibacterium luteolum]|nr:DUF4180 domain-containing protein [Pelagibacterium luteolum]
MMDDVVEIAGKTALMVSGAENLSAATLSNDLIGMAWSDDAQMVVVEASVLPDAFFELRSGIIGDVAQKFANYRLLMVVVGDVQRFADRSTAFRDYLFETNAGGNLWFVPDMDALERKLAL